MILVLPSRIKLQPSGIRFKGLAAGGGKQKRRRLIRKQRRSSTVCGSLVFQLTVEYHVGDFETHVDLDRGLGEREFRVEANLAALCVQERLAIEGARENEFCPRAVAARRLILAGENALAVFALEVCRVLDGISDC